MNIRRAGEDDFDALKELKLLSKKEELTYSEILKPLEESESFYLEYLMCDLTRTDREVLIAEDNGDIVGIVVAKALDTMSISLFEQKGYVSNLFVLSSHRGKGLGSELLRRALEWLKEQGISHVSVEIHTGNEAALRLYEKADFGEYTVKLTKHL